ncbi:hypothetical protein BGZ80_007022, partial [Entomortierella chlamydospora]
MAQSQTLASPSTTTVVQIPESTKYTSEEMSHESTQVTSMEKKPTGIESLREKLRPLLLYIVSTAQFLDIVNGASVSVAILPIAEDLNFS